MSLFKTVMQDIRVAYPNFLDRDEQRPIRFGLTESAIEQTASPFSIINNDLRAKAMASHGRNVEIPVMSKGEITLKAGRTCSITNFENESDMIGLSWTTLVADISMYPAQYATNEIQYIQDMARKIQLVKEAFMRQMETDCLATLEASKSSVFGSTMVGAGGVYALTGDAIRVPLALQPDFFNDLDPIQNADDFYGNHYIVGSTPLMSPVNKFINQGAGNSENLNYQFAGKTYRFSNGVTNGAGVRSTGFIMPIGTLGLLTRVDQTARLGLKTTTGTQWSVENIDGLPFEVGVQYKSDCTDLSALDGLGHLSSTAKENWQISMDFCFVTPYNSDDTTKAGAIKKFEFLNT